MKTFPWAHKIVQFGLMAMTVSGCKNGELLFDGKSDVCKDFDKVYYTNLPAGTEGPYVEMLVTPDDEPSCKNLVYKDPRGNDWKLRFAEDNNGYQLKSFVYERRNKAGSVQHKIEYKNYILQEEVRPLSDTNPLFVQGVFSTFHDEAGKMLLILLPQHKIHNQPGEASVPLDTTNTAQEISRAYGFEENQSRTKFIP